MVLGKGVERGEVSERGQRLLGEGVRGFGGWGCGVRGSGRRKHSLSGAGGGRRETLDSQAHNPI